MPANLDPNAIGAAFAQPNNDGSFTGDFADYLAVSGGVALFHRLRISADSRRHFCAPQPSSRSTVG